MMYLRRRLRRRGRQEEEVSREKTLGVEFRTGLGSARIGGFCF